MLVFDLTSEQATPLLSNVTETSLLLLGVCLGVEPFCCRVNVLAVVVLGVLSDGWAFDLTMLGPPVSSSMLASWVGDDDDDVGDDDEDESNDMVGDEGAAVLALVNISDGLFRLVVELIALTLLGVFWLISMLFILLAILFTLLLLPLAVELPPAESELCKVWTPRVGVSGVLVSFAAELVVFSRLNVVPVDIEDIHNNQKKENPFAFCLFYSFCRSNQKIVGKFFLSK